MHTLMRLAIAASCLISNVVTTAFPTAAGNSTSVIKPKIFIISMFNYEEEAWQGISDFDIYEKNITVPGFSPIYPDAHCTSDGEICQFTIGESEINAASSVMALALSPKFDLTTTYFMVAGIAGVNPEVASICSVTFARYAVQVGLQYEFSQFEIPTNFTSGYIPLGAKTPQQYPTSIYGTEVIEFNKNLQHWAATQARKAKLTDSKDAKVYRANYASNPAYALGAAPPAVYECDVATSDQYYSGVILSEAMGNFTSLVTNGTGNYCTTAQEDNATGEALLRAALIKLVDFNRIIVMRTASDFDRPWPGEAATTNLFWAEQGAFVPAIDNIYYAGIEVVKGILNSWENQFAAGMNASNYVGDIFGTLGGTPDFGPYVSNNNPVKRDGVKHFARRSAKAPKGRRIRVL